jgi:hypothetical protein
MVKYEFHRLSMLTMCNESIKMEGAVDSHSCHERQIIQFPHHHQM